MDSWTKIGVDVVVGGVAGAVDQAIQNMDEKRGIDERAAGRLAANAKLPMMKQFGTYLNYGVPILAILGTALGWVKGDMATRLVTAGSQLASRKVTHTFTTTSTSATPSAAFTEWRRQIAAEEARRTAERRRAEQTTKSDFEGQESY